VDWIRWSRRLRTGSAVAAAGDTASRLTAGRRTVAGTRPTSATTSLASASPAAPFAESVGRHQWWPLRLKLCCFRECSFAVDPTDSGLIENGPDCRTLLIIATLAQFGGGGIEQD
jgi:hypothetical protein